MAERALPPLAAIRCFEAAARHLNFTQAAKELGMTQAAVSYQIKSLEGRLGAPLFIRGSRGIALSDLGARLAPAVSESFAQLRAAFDQVTSSNESVLNITALPTFATNWLVPRLGAFQLAHPEIAVRLDTSHKMIDFAREDFDVGLRSGGGVWPGLAAHHIMPAAYTPMLSPGLLAKHGSLHRPQELLDLPLIDPTDPWWKAWFAEACVPDADLAKSSGIQVMNQQLSGRAALAGQGVAILMPALFAEEIAEGRLVQPFPLIRNAPDEHYWLVYPEARRRLKKVRAFRDWILAEADKTIIPSSEPI